MLTVDRDRVLRDRLFEKVKCWKFTPDVAENVARRLCLEPLNPLPDPAQCDPMCAPRWSFAMSLAWIIWRDGNKVRIYQEKWRRALHVWRGIQVPGHPEQMSLIPFAMLPHKGPYGTCREVDADVGLATAKGNAPIESFEDAKAALWNALLLGKKLTADAIIDHSSGHRVEIPSRDFQDLDIARGSGGADCLQRGMAVGIRYLRPTLGRADVVGLWKAPPSTVKAESDCRKWLEGEMRKSQQAHPHPRAYYENEANGRFRVAARAFDRAWRSALKETGARWSSPGRPRKSSH